LSSPPGESELLSPDLLNRRLLAARPVALPTRASYSTDDACAEADKEISIRVSENGACSCSKPPMKNLEGVRSRAKLGPDPAQVPQHEDGPRPIALSSARELDLCRGRG